ncbi:HPF/RaiA family ribosome-associated protein [Dehalogenimonas sp. THU2]|uniref:HPF/RaiA family ribosome-associated protein n=1 Tax=Dehalogenimonas sp. THU2 TaxID=3151121 RepID=UPI003218C5A2
MEIIITTKNLTLDEKTRAQIVRKFDKVGRHLPQARELRLELIEEATKAAKDRFVVRGILEVLGPVMTAECRAASLITAIDQLEGVLDRQVHDFKTKNTDFDRESQRFGAATYTETEPLPPIISEESEVSIEVEHFTPKPMSLPDAIANLSETKDDFLLFRSSKGGVSLLHRQELGGFKLIEIEAV